MRNKISPLEIIEWAQRILVGYDGGGGVDYGDDDDIEWRKPLRKPSIPPENENKNGNRA